jgi:uncharacterized membrane protein
MAPSPLKIRPGSRLVTICDHLSSLDLNLDRLGRIIPEDVDYLHHHRGLAGLRVRLPCFQFEFRVLARAVRLLSNPLTRSRLLIANYVLSIAALYSPRRAARLQLAR